MSKKNNHNILNSKDSYNFSYDFENKTNHLIKVDTLLQSQLNINIVLQELKHEICPDQELSVYIRPYKEGSFVTEYLPEIVATGSIIFEHIDYINSIFEVFGNVMDLWKYFKGEKIQKEQIVQDQNISSPINDSRQIVLNVNVAGNNNQIQIDERAFNFYTKNISGNRAINKIGKALNDDNSVTEFNLKHKNKIIFSTKKSDFLALLNKNEYIKDAENQEEQIEKVRLYVKKIDVKPNKKATFTFIYREQKINTKIFDEGFLNKIRRGQKFGNGDSIIANLSVFKKFDDTVNTYVVKGYAINKVHKIEKNGSKGGKQSNLFEE